MGVVGVCGVLSVPSPAALVVMGVGGPIGFVGGVIVGLAGAGAVFGVGAGAVGIEVVGGGVAVVVGAVVVGGGGGGVAARVRWAAAQLPTVRRAISATSRFVIRFSLARRAQPPDVKRLRCVSLKCQTIKEWRAIRRIP